jgi:hypothetical protein
MAVGETFKATIIAQHNDGTAIINDFGYVDLAGSSAHIDTGTAAGAFQTLVQAVFVAAMVADVSIFRYRFACVGGTHKGEIGFVDVSGGIAGANTSGELPKEMCISMKRQTGYASKRDRGRIFFGPVALDYWAGPTIAPDKVNAGVAEIVAVSNLLKANLTVSAVVLSPVILAGDGTYSGKVINRVSIPSELVHRKSRRVRVGA